MINWRGQLGLLYQGNVGLLLVELAYSWLSHGYRAYDYGRMFSFSWDTK